MKWTVYRLAEDFSQTEILKTYLSERKKRQKSFRAEEIEIGKINRFRFARSYWTATYEVSNPPVEQTGVEYCATDGSYVILFSVLDDEEFAQSSLPVAEAVVQSLKEVSKSPSARNKQPPTEQFFSISSFGGAIR